jgi:hypothetical protein
VNYGRKASKLSIWWDKPRGTWRSWANRWIANSKRRKCKERLSGTRTESRAGSPEKGRTVETERFRGWVRAKTETYRQWRNRDIAYLDDDLDPNEDVYLIKDPRPKTKWAEEVERVIADHYAKPNRTPEEDAEIKFMSEVYSLFSCNDDRWLEGTHRFLMKMALRRYRHVNRREKRSRNRSRNLEG